MSKKRTTVFISNDLILPLEHHTAKSKQNLTELFDIFLRKLLGIEKSPSLLDRVENLERKVVEIEIDLKSKKAL